MPEYVKDGHPWFGAKPFRTASMFSTAAFSDRFLRGLGGKWMDFNHRFIERLQSQSEPIRGGRVFIEAIWDGGHDFFNEDRSSSTRMWDYGALRRDERPGANPTKPALTVHMQKHLLWLVKLARRHDFKLELVVDATLKHTDGVGWNVIGQCIRQTAAFMRLVHIAKWDTGVDGNAIGHPTNDRADDAIRALFDEVKGPIADLIALEPHNEWDAHSQGAWARDGMDRGGALKEVNRQLERMKRLKDGEPEQWPEGAVWVSHGGRDDIEYDPTYADAVAIHPSRPETRVGDRFRHLRKHGKPIYANEILHYIDPSMWYLVEDGTFRPGSSTKDTRDRMRFVDEMLADGMWVCEHSLTNMANGRWKDEDVYYEEMPLDQYELARGALGTAPHPPKPNPPPQDPDLPPSSSGAKLFVTAPDKNGVRSLRVEFPDLWPRVVPGVKPEDAVTETHDVDLPEAFTFYAAGSFIGLDRGDIGEYAVVIAARGGPEIYSRSFHKETAAPFDSEDWKFAAFVTTDKLRIWLTARTTGANDLMRPGEPWSSRPHFGVRLWTYTGHHKK